MLTPIRRPAGAEITDMQRIDAMETGNRSPAILQTTTVSRTRAQMRAEIESNIVRRPNVRITRGCAAAFTVPLLILGGGCGLIGDGVRRHSQSGGFAEEKCQLHGITYDSPCGSSSGETVYAPDDHRSKVAAVEIASGSFVTLFGLSAVCMARWATRPIFGGW